MKDFLRSIVRPPDGASKRQAQALTAKNAGVPIGQWNHAIGIYGWRGSGKSQLAAILALQLQKKGPAYVIAHDAGFRIPSKTHDGINLGVRRHQTREQVLAALSGPYPDGIHAWGGQYVKDGVRRTVQADDVIQLAIEVADASKLRAARAAGIETDNALDPRLEGIKAVPVVVIIDEAVMARGASKHRLSADMADFLISLRHLHVGYIWTAQGGNMVHYEKLNQATELWLAKTTHARALKAFEDAGVPKAIVEDLPTLEKYVFHQVDMT